MGEHRRIKATRRCPRCGETKHTTWIGDICRPCYRRSGGKASSSCVWCGIKRTALTEDGYCERCIRQTDEAIDKTIEEQLKNAPLWFWREVRSRGLAYEIPPDVLSKLELATVAKEPS
jgi:hypothetical protein